jgi:hypothetical protein
METHIFLLVLLALLFLGSVSHRYITLVDSLVSLGLFLLLLLLSLLLGVLVLNLCRGEVEVIRIGMIGYRNSPTVGRIKVNANELVMISTCIIESTTDRSFEIQSGLHRRRPLQHWQFPRQEHRHPYQQPQTFSSS